MEQITIKKVAELANVSKTTVSKYLNGGNVKDEYREKVESALKVLNYRPNYIARALKTNRTYTIGVLIPFINDRYSTQIVAEIESYFQDNGYGMLICGYEGNSERFRVKMSFLLSKMIDAVVVFPSGLCKEDFDEIEKAQIPICIIDREIEGVDADVVMTDNEYAGYFGAKYIMDLGHERMAFITGYNSSYTSSRRNAGILKALKERGVKEENYIFEYCYNSEDIFEQVKSVIESPKKPTVLFSTNFYLTNKTINALNRLNIRVPEDVSLLAFDNVDTYSVYTTRLTIVSQLAKKISREAVNIILGRIADPECEKKLVKMSIELIEGESIKKLT